MSHRRWNPVLTAGRSWALAGAAATMLAFLAVLVGISLPLRAPARLFETGAGERRVAILEDGSRISLDGATKVEARFSAGRRELRLIAGRAKFDVARDPLRPFSVMAGDKAVVATGTSFSVELLRRNVHVLLYEGHVAVLQEGKGAARMPQVKLARDATPADQGFTPGHELIAPMEAGTAVVVPADDGSTSSWEAGQLVFDEEALSSAVERFNRDSRSRIMLGNQEVGSFRVTGVFSAGDVDAFLEGVAALHPVTVTRRDGDIILDVKKTFTKSSNKVSDLK